MKIGLALSGGGVRCASQLGMAQFLREQGVKPTIFAGTSGGSIVATLLALGYTPEKALGLFRKTGDIKDYAYAHVIASLIKRQPFQGLIKGEKLEEILRDIFSAKYPKVVPIANKLGIVTTDINTGTQVIFTLGDYINTKLVNDDNIDVRFATHTSLARLVTASCSIPGLFVPKGADGMTLVDGGITNNLPSDIAFALGAEKVISMDLGYSGERGKVLGIYEILMQSLYILIERGVDNNRKSFGIYLNPKIYDVAGLDMRRIDECFERGYKYMKANFKAVDDYLEG